MINPLQNIMATPGTAPVMEATTSSGTTTAPVSDLRIKDFKSLIEKYAELLPTGVSKDPREPLSLEIVAPQGMILPQEGKALPVTVMAPKDIDALLAGKIEVEVAEVADVEDGSLLPIGVVHVPSPLLNKAAPQVLSPDEGLKKLLVLSSTSSPGPSPAMPKELLSDMPKAVTEALPPLDQSGPQIQAIIAKEPNAGGAKQNTLSLLQVQQHALVPTDVPVAVTKEGINIQAMTQFANAMTQMNQSTPMSSSPVQVQTITTPVGHQQWGGDVGNRVMWMAQQNIQTADIKLNPPHLGPIEVRVSLGNDNNVSVSFTSHHAQVREALDTAIPRLRDMLMDNGLQLADANVSHRQTPNQDQTRQDSGANGQYADETGFDGSEAGEINKDDEHQNILTMSLVDYYA